MTATCTDAVTWPLATLLIVCAICLTAMVVAMVVVERRQ